MTQQGNPKPFEDLSPTDQVVAIEIAVVASLLITRLPAASDLIFDAISKEFAAFYDIRSNIAKYALRSLGQTLFNTQWTFSIIKDAQGNILTSFKQGDPVVHENGTTP
jgi:hypothetical protein